MELQQIYFIDKFPAKLDPHFLRAQSSATSHPHLVFLSTIDCHYTHNLFHIHFNISGKIPTLTLAQVHRFITGLDAPPPLGWGDHAFPSVMFCEPKSKYLEARTCGPTVLLPLAKYESYEEFKNIAVESIVSSPSILAD